MIRELQIVHIVHSIVFGSSRDKDRLRFPKNAPAAKIIAAWLSSYPVDQVDRSFKNLLQRIFDSELDQQVCVTTLAVEVLISRGGAENVSRRT